MGLLLDIVPNHMAATVDNPWWADLLEHGRSSPYAPFFDIDWEGHPQGRIVLPILGAPLEEVLRSGELRLGLDEHGFFVRYQATRLPLDPSSYPTVLSHPAGLAKQLAPLLTSLQRLPTWTVTAAPESEERRGAAEQVKRELWRLYNGRPDVRRFIDDTIGIFNGRASALLHEVVRQQPYELAHWRTGRERLNYRRFFDISHLVGLRVEEPAVFQATHDLILRLVREGKATGLRVDHIDGLRDPLRYLERLQRAVARKGAPFYVLVEKILLGEETLPDGWPASGTTGYEFANLVNGLFVDREGLARLGTTYRRFSGSPPNFSDVVYKQKKRVLPDLFPGELRDLSQHLRGLAQDDSAGDADDLTAALVEVSACLPVYRTYTRSFEVSARDRGYVEDAVQEARRRNPALSAATEFLRRVLLLDYPRSLPPPARRRWLEFVMRWQQFTGPVTAKGLEDTALYNYSRLVSLNEVGGDPDAPASVERFHEHNVQTLSRWPHTLNATSTHDTKRGEDVRARINILSQMPAAWARRLHRWRRLNQGKKRRLNGRAAPDPNEEMLLYQTLVGAWPLAAHALPEFRERVKAYMVKAAREAKVNTTWLDPDEAYEGALAGFVEAILSPSSREFLEDFRRFQDDIAHYGALNSLAQTLLKIASPGVPDFYQGTELWDLSLVDPDNRRPVEFAERSRLLGSLPAGEGEDQIGLVRELLARWSDGRLKMYLIARALRYRRSEASLFAAGDYLPLEAAGEREGNLVTFARNRGAAWALVAVPRLVSELCPPGRLPLGRRVWKDTVLLLPPQAPDLWQDVLTGATLATSGGQAAKVIEAHKALRHFPVSLLAGL